MRILTHVAEAIHRCKEDGYFPKEIMLSPKNVALLSRELSSLLSAVDSPASASNSALTVYGLSLTANKFTQDYVVKALTGRGYILTYTMEDPVAMTAASGAPKSTVTDEVGGV